MGVSVGVRECDAVAVSVVVGVGVDVVVAVGVHVGVGVYETVLERIAVCVTSRCA